LHLCTTQIRDNRYKGYCLRCFIHLFPNEPTILNYKTKEKAVADYVFKEIKNVTLIFDKKIQDGCSKRRPDILLDLGFRVINIEIDEHKHDTYDSICEYKRIADISEDLGFRPVILIRFNPDSYTVNNKYISSCWKSEGKCHVPKNKKKEWDTRLELLKENILFWMDSANKSEELVKMVHLFYNS